MTSGPVNQVNQNPLAVNVVLGLDVCLIITLLLFVLRDVLSRSLAFMALVKCCDGNMTFPNLYCVCVVYYRIDLHTSRAVMGHLMTGRRTYPHSRF